ncbi:MAG: 3-deoxy-7-phosphoheptulonate synthase [Bacteroidota bacterium]
MIIHLNKDATEIEINSIYTVLKEIKYKPSLVDTRNEKYIVCIGTAEFDIRAIGNMPGVSDTYRVSDSYKLVSKKWKLKYSSIDLGNETQIGAGELSIMAGPCSIENEEQVTKIVDHLVANNVKIMRGGVYKPRSSPYSFRGMGLEGLAMFYDIAHKAGIKIISEVMDVSQIKSMYPYVDIFQVGTRNSQNFNLLDELGQIDKPVLLKRAMNGTIEELLHSAEYIFSKGNEELMLCERGIRTYETAYRNTFDINAIALLKEKTHLPVIADPSHGIGIRAHVPAIALAAVAAGADGIIYEVHEKPEEAASDGYQTLNFDESVKLIKRVRVLSESLN